MVTLSETGQKIKKGKNNTGKGETKREKKCDNLGI